MAKSKDKKTETKAEKTVKKQTKKEKKEALDLPSLRGREFIGKVISGKMQKTVSVEWERREFIKKYERYAKRRTKVKAHNPESINAKEGDLVRIKECRPLSKTKKFCVVEVLDKE